MKRLFWSFVIVASLWICMPPALSSAQTTNPTNPYTSITPLVPAVKPPSPANQWVSHQMNQPPPETDDKYSFSPGLIEEIKDLYQQAKKDYEAKAAGKSQHNKDSVQKPANPTKGK